MTKVSSNQRKNKRGVDMYTFAYGTGNKRKSVTKHCTEAEAKAFKSSLGGV